MYRMMSRYADMKIEPSATGDGWYWAIAIGGDIYADGECVTASEARDHAHAAWKEWNSKQ